LQNVKQIIFALVFTSFLMGQELKEKAPPNHIGTIIFQAEEQIENTPIVELGKAFTLSFDDLNADEAYYYYTIQHANADWTASELFKSEYINGFDEVRIRNMSNSSATLQSYTHYALSIPNRDTEIISSGNYVLSVFDDKQELVFTKRFVVYEQQANVQVGVFRLRDLEGIDSKQRIEIGVQTAKINTRQPDQEISVWALQNYRWSSARKIPKYDYVMNQSLRFEYDNNLIFEGGNEYLFFDTKDIRSAGGNVAYIRRENLYQSILYPNYVRNGTVYTYAPDINGNFVIQTTEGFNPNTDADYTEVTFRLRSSETNYDFYVTGLFNQHLPQPVHKLEYDSANNLHQLTIRLKQGVYNYKYIAIGSAGQLFENGVGGSYWETENEYLALVYMRKFGDRYDRLIGVGIGNSRQIQN
tara:strand:+ start:1071 stop:2312 length:1242 start_codon:yes stop_codon:yes gene_type:complete